MSYEVMSCDVTSNVTFCHIIGGEGFRRDQPLTRPPVCLCVSAGLQPGTQYQISVQAIVGATEGKASSATGVTGQWPEG